MNEDNYRTDEDEFFSYCIGDITVRVRYNNITISEEIFPAREPEFVPLDLDKILSE